MSTRMFLANLISFLGATATAMIVRAGEPPRPSEVPAGAASAEARFAVDLFGKVGEKGGNLAFSPFSISTALGMTLAGAKGQTAEGMAKVLHLRADDPATQDAFAKAIAAVNEEDGKKGAGKLLTANALFGQVGEPFAPDYLRLVESKYRAMVEPLDFARKTDASRRRINAWVEEKTADKIKDLLAPDTIKPTTSFVLVNAVYFKGAWKAPFQPQATSKAPFTLEDGTKVEVPTMRHLERHSYVETDEAQILSMDYVDRGRSMVVILPKKAGGLRELEKSLTADRLEGWLKRLRAEKVAVELPKFRSTSSFQLKQPLVELGMEKAFTGSADFTGIRPSGEIMLSDVIHKAYVDVNEEGTEAAAATAVIALRATAAVQTPKSFKADRPFLFLIRDEKSGAWLFLGRVADPRP